MDLQALLSHAITIHRAGHLAQAEAEYRHVLSLDPDNANALHLLGVLCHQTHRNPEAIDLLNRAIALDDRVSAFHCNLGMVLAKLSFFPPAITELRRAIQLDPNSADAHNNLANVYKQTGEIERAVESARRAATLRKDPRLAGNLLYLLYLHPAHDAPAIAAAHRAWRRAFADPLKEFVRPHPNSRDPDRRLKIGFVLPYLADHPVVRFLLPYLEHHDRARFELFCYFDRGDLSTQTDLTVAPIRNLPIRLISTSALDDAQAADVIRRDGIDILIDLTMHTEDNRLLMFARKPAPVQVTWLAYAGSTGLDTVDYRLTDPYLDPPGFDPSIYSEASLYLESFWCYWPPPDAPPVGPLPATSKGRVTFGCLNNYAKVSRPTLELWGGILSAAPDSRLILFCPEGPGRDRAIAHFRGAGVSPERITFAGPMKSTDYFALYNQIDIALDPFPYAGGTTTCDALWMGVPVVTLSGKIAVSRAGASILSNAGLSQFVTSIPEVYKSLALSLAANTAHLTQVRSTLRPRVQSSRLTDASRFARVFETVLRRAWTPFCQTPLL